MTTEKHPILTLLKASTITQWFWYFPWAWDLNVFFKACFPSEKIKMSANTFSEHMLHILHGNQTSLHFSSLSKTQLGTRQGQPRTGRKILAWLMTLPLPVMVHCIAGFGKPSTWQIMVLDSPLGSVFFVILIWGFPKILLQLKHHNWNTKRDQISNSWRRKKKKNCCWIFSLPSTMSVSDSLFFSPSTSWRAVSQT